MQIEPATGADVSTLADAWVALAAEQRSYHSHLFAAENRDRIRESMAHHAVEGTCLVARPTDEHEDTISGEAADHLVGFVTFSVESDGYAMDVTRGIIENLYVEPDARGEGIGSELLAAAERELAARSVDVVSLEVLAANDRARDFYDRAGYDDHRVVMEKRIDVETDTKGNHRL